MLTIEDIVKATFEEGDLLIVARKGRGKTVTLWNLAKAFRKQPNTRVIIFEDFPKWINEFDTIPYFIIEDSSVRESSHAIDLEDIWLRHERDYTILKGYEIKQALKHNKDIIFLSEIEDIDRQAFFIYSIFNHFYRKAYLRAKKNIRKKERIVFLLEESQNIADRATMSRKLFNRFKKKFNVARNLGLHFVLATQRFQDLATPIRGRCIQLIGRVNTDDYELKVGRLLRHSKHRAQVKTLEKGEFIFVPTDSLIKFPMFKQNGKPFEFKPQLKPQPKAQPKLTLWSRLKGIYDLLFTPKPFTKKPKKPFYWQKEAETDKFDEEDDEYIEELETSNESEEFTPL